MQKLIVAAIAAACAAPLAVPATPVAAQPVPQARIWVDGDRDIFSRGDRMRVRFSTDRSAYVAVIHVDTDGTLDFLYPASPWDDGYLPGGMVHTLPSRYSNWSVRGRSGLGYLYIVASDTPLDFSYFGGQYRGSWDWSYAGRHVRGDPYVALEQITRILVPEWEYGRYSVDYHSYHVGRRHHYPVYACGTGRWGYDYYGWGWTRHYGSCDRLVVFLRRYPSYYDARRYRGTRYVYLRGEPIPDVRHGYKAPARAGSGSNLADPDRRATERTSTGAVRSTGVEQPRQRPTLERRPEQARPANATPRSGATRGAERPAVSAPRGGWGTPDARTSSGSSGESRPAARPTPRGGSGGGEARPSTSTPARSGGQARPAAKPAARSSGNARPASPSPARSSGSARPSSSSSSRNSGSARPASSSSSGRSGNTSRPSRRGGD